MGTGERPGPPAGATIEPAPAAADTEALGARIADRLRPGDVVRLHGELGAGKTTLVRGAVARMGAAGPVRSPTFGLAHWYRGGRLPVHHLDLYRLAALGEEEADLVLDELPPDGVAFVEWPEVAADLLEGLPGLAVTLRHLPDGGREVELRPPGRGRGAPPGDGSR